MKERGQQMTHTKNKNLSYPEEKAYRYIRQQFADQGITIKEMALEAKEDQDKHHVKASLETYIKAIQSQLHKHDVMSCIMTGLLLTDWQNSISCQTPYKLLLKMICHCTRLMS